jgi:NADP-dependent 3-hydroxy acid dehydrogenase YdfG
MSAHIPPRTILITGASRGIGAAIAIALANPGTVLALTGRDETALQVVADACRDRGAAARCFPADLSKAWRLPGLVSSIRELCGPVHTLINSAGIFLEASILEGDMDAWDQALDVNLKASIHLTRHVLTEMPAGGAVVFIASFASRKAYAGGSNYCAAKFGLLGFAGSLFEDVRERGIKVCSILPGLVNTQMHAGDEDLDPAKMIQPEDVAQAVTFALSMPVHVCPTEITLQPQHTPRRARRGSW